MLKKCLLSASLGAIAVAILFSPGGLRSMAFGAAMGAFSGLIAELLVWRTSPRLDTVELSAAERKRVTKSAVVALAVVALLATLAFLVTADPQRALGIAFLGVLGGTLYLSWHVHRIAADR
jgi:hypothetical protein